MHSLCLLHIVFFALTAAVLGTARPTDLDVFNCIGGSLYFIAHPTDSLLYQNPDLLHDLYVYRCVTTVVLTSGDRGIVGNHSYALEQGIEAAYSWMSGLAVENQTWKTSTVRIAENNFQLASQVAVPNVQNVYLRLPDGAPTGQGYESNDRESLRKLYNGDIKTITTTDGNATYTLESLMDLIGAILHKSNATDVRVLDHKTGIPDDEDARFDHADHVVSARLVVEVMKREKSDGKLQGYAGGFARNFDSNLNETSLDFERKVAAFLEYAKHDQHMCQSLNQCQEKPRNKAQDQVFQDHDVLYTAEALGREYYVF